jgi:5-methylcytosine-specific restriction enzyme B
MNSLDPRVEKSLRDAHGSLELRGEFLSAERMQASYAAFRSHFGPDVLKSLDGPALLNTMHTHGNKESLVYWLEFKNDDEFPGPAFGGIAGGSAHKFGLFRRKETGRWVTGPPTHVQNISEADAIAIARKHRDQLLLGCALLQAVPAGGDDSTYLELQTDLEKQTPDISGVAWAHKYWSLVFPEKLDDFHVERFQRYNLSRLLQTPPGQDGLYVCAGRFVQLAANMGWPMNHFTTVLNERNGPPIRYWRVGTRVLPQNLVRDSRLIEGPRGRVGALRIIGF